MAMMKDKVATIRDQALVAALFIVLSIAVLYLFVTFAEPMERQPGSVASKYDNAALLGALSQNGLARQMAAIEAASVDPANPRVIGRLTGSSGCANTEQLILEQFTAAGLNIQTQEFQTLVPDTRQCELSVNGTPVPGVMLYPFEPSGLVTNPLPKGGVSGPLVLINSTAPRELVAHPIEGAIVVSRGTDASWPTLAQLGAKALIIIDDPAESSNPDRPVEWQKFATGYDVHYPRFYARGVAIEQLVGQEVTLQSDVRWKSVTGRNIIGVMAGKAKTGKREALVLSAHYDSYSNIPELAPGAEQAVSLAVLLELVRGLAPYAGRMDRDVIFVATAGHGQALEGVCKLIESIEKISKPQLTDATFAQQIDEHEQKLRFIAHAKKILDAQPWDVASAAYRAQWGKEDPQFRGWFEKVFSTVAGDVTMEQREGSVQARLDWIRAGKPTFTDAFLRRMATATEAERAKAENRHPLLARYLLERERDTRAGDVTSTPFWDVKRGYPQQFEEYDYPEELRKYFDGDVAREFEGVQAYHERRIRELKDQRAIYQLFQNYSATLTLNLALSSGGTALKRDLGLAVGRNGIGTIIEPQNTEIRNLIADHVPYVNGNLAFSVTNWGARDTGGKTSDVTILAAGRDYFESRAWHEGSYLAFSLINNGYFPYRMGTPEDTFARLQLDAVQEQLPVIAESILSIGYGAVTFKPLNDRPTLSSSIRGNVFTAVGSGSLVPNNPVFRNTVVRAYPQTNPGLLELASQYGVQRYPVLQVDPYGKYERTTVQFSQFATLMSVYGARYDNEGHVIYVKDSSATSQGIFKNENVAFIPYKGRGENNLEMFRAVPVACYQKGNPKTLNSFARFDFLLSDGLTPVIRSYIETNVGAPGVLAYLEPDTTFYIGLLDGSAENPDIQSYRAFMLNVDEKKPLAQDREELQGQGYIAADTPNITFPFFDGAASMLRTNEKRMKLQRQYKMADAQMEQSHKLGYELLADAQKFRAEGDVITASNAAGRAMATVMSNHPVIRTKISNAILGIIWYLVLLVPFVFFFEKLLFGFTDIRKQLFAVAIIFILVFFLLQTFHPAFKMVRSSMMILLGFLIALVSLVVTSMVSGKFKQNLQSFRRREGNVEGADINRSGVIGTAFMLGLNNMRRRKVRTGLTSVTLVLITFVMICFTSVSSDIQSTEYITGRASSNGLMRRDPQFIPLTEAELANWRQLYGLRFPVTQHYWLTSQLNPQYGLKNPEIVIDRDFVINEQKAQRRVTASAAITMEWVEPQFSGIDKYLLTNRGWFPPMPAPNYIFLPDNYARDLQISVADVNAGGVKLSIRNEEYEVLGIFDSARMTSHTGFDGETIMPYDLNSLQSLGKSSSGLTYVVPEKIQRLRSAQVVITNKAIGLQPQEINIAISCSVLFPSEEYQLQAGDPLLSGITIREQRELVTEYLERVGTGSYYAIDGISYYGSRERKKTLGGLLGLLIPILLASMTVFNTMRGSVFERKDEIYVYNAVGIAPNHVFFMFMAEACVYAVIGAMLGYLLSQVTGTILTALNVTGGLNMDYSSIETIYASLAIVASVLISTLIPAREAARLASPSEETSWSIPKADGDLMTFNLPFTFTKHDRVAIISYFYRWLRANGEGSSGIFFCSPPMIAMHTHALVGPGEELVPSITTTIWLKPFDLGVSQRLIISLPTDPETGEYIAKIEIERLSGTIAAWTRTILPFLKALRKQFLNWRAVTDEERDEMFAEAKTLVFNAHKEEMSSHG